MREYKHDPKCCNIGGIRCPCCAPFKPSKTKRLINRRYRRKAAQKLATTQITLAMTGTEG